jgi:MoxR-like ATPase
MTMTPEEATRFAANLDRLVGAVEEVLLGKNRVVRLAFTAFLSEGHLLLDDVPGTGKTSLAAGHGPVGRRLEQPRAVHARPAAGRHHGVTVYDQRRGAFEFHPGPVFANIVLADEINRASPKTQSALLEVMEEGQVTVDGQTHPVGHPFMVIATQNPVEQAGTYRLPEAQLDRFLMRSSIGYPRPRLDDQDPRGRRPPRARPPHRAAARRRGDRRHGRPRPHRLRGSDDPRLRVATRRCDAHGQEVRLGVSVRGALALIRAAKTHAAGRGRHYVVPDDVKALAEPVLAHRLILDAEAEFDGVTTSNMVAQVLIETPPPSSRQAV